MTKGLEAIGFLILAAYGIAGAFRSDYFQILDGANLLFHEAGHLFFSFDGEYLSIWGGTLLQLLIPLGIAAAFWIKRERSSAAVMLWWFGQNLFGISIYIQDARRQTLARVGGEIHDWEYILRAHGWLEREMAIGTFVWWLGIFIILAASGYGFYNVLLELGKEKKNASA